MAQLSAGSVWVDRTVPLDGTFRHTFNEVGVVAIGAVMWGLGRLLVGDDQADLRRLVKVLEQLHNLAERGRR